MATVTDDPLSKKVEMTNWEKVSVPEIVRAWIEADRSIRAITSITSAFFPSYSAKIRFCYSDINEDGPQDMR